jgi:hypothetical protein
MYCASASVRTPRMRWRVVCGLDETMLTLAPTSALTRVDLPTLGRPTTAMTPVLKLNFFQFDQGRFGGHLFRGLAVRAMARSHHIARGNAAFDMKDLGMRLAGGLGEDVIGQPRRRGCSHSCKRVLASLP